MVRGICVQSGYYSTSLVVYIPVIYDDSIQDGGGFPSGVKNIELEESARKKES